MFNDLKIWAWLYEKEIDEFLFLGAVLDGWIWAFNLFPVFARIAGMLCSLALPFMMWHETRVRLKK